MRSILYISGSRADYGPARRLLKELNAHPDFSLRLLVTGMHLDPIHGETWQEIAADGLEIGEKVYGKVTGDSLTTMAASIGLYLYGMSVAMERLKPDIVLLLGDRGEQMAGAMAAAFQNITTVHLCGGSVSGSIDDSIRHAITKFAHYHLTAFNEHAQRIAQMGESTETIRVVGLPGGDLHSDAVYSRDEVCKRYNLPIDQPYLLVIQHPVTHTCDEAEVQIIETLEAVARTGVPTLLANPNDDAGGRAVLAAMRRYAEKNLKFQILPPPKSRELFASIMANAGALVGNSSSGIVEAMSIALPVVNIGDRQRGREHLACLLNVGYTRTDIFTAINTALYDKGHAAKVHGFSKQILSQQTEQKIIEFLSTADISAGRRPKDFVDRM